MTEHQVPPGQDLLAAARFQPGPQPAGGDPPAGRAHPSRWRCARRCYQEDLRGFAGGTRSSGFGLVTAARIIPSPPRRLPGALGAGRTERVLRVVAVQCAWVGEWGGERVVFAGAVVVVGGDVVMKGRRREGMSSWGET